MFEMKKRILMAVLVFAAVNMFFLCWLYQNLNIFAILKDLHISVWGMMYGAFA